MIVRLHSTMKTSGILDNRQAGILMPVSSLPSPHGIGDLGDNAYAFLKTSKAMGFKIWQLLPLNPLGYGNSPYQPFSSFAGDELYISLDLITKKGLLEEVPPFHKFDTSIAYDDVREYKNIYLKKAFKKFTPDTDYEAFLKQAFWLEDYAQFMALKRLNHNRSWHEWTIKSLSEKDQKEKDYVCFLQYVFYKQWTALKDYAHDLDIMIMGDMPFYVGLDSADVYSHKSCFLLDKDGYPTSVAGVPPDYFSEDGQLWGNPLYDWTYLKKHHYSFWLQRLEWNNELFDIIRIDHFRAFDTYWKIPANETTAKNGKWIEGPAYDFFDVVFEKDPFLTVIAEDLGDLRPEVLKLKDHYQMLGMRIIQYSFGPQEEKENFKIPEFCISYTGTHDNSPVNGWYHDLSKIEKKRIRRIMHHFHYKGKTMADKVTYRALDCDARVAIIPMQDLLDLEGDARINTPGTIGAPNWCWRLDSLTGYEHRTNHIKELLKKTSRL